MATDEPTVFESWAILELMGHRRLGGFVREVQIAGTGLLRIDVPGDVDGEVQATQFYSPSSLYCMTPCTEATAREVARMTRPAPVQRWELPVAHRRGEDEDEEFARDMVHDRDY
jgi:hypothetical protein